MSKHSTHRKLKLKPVTVEDIDQFNELLRYVFQVTGEEIISSGYEDEEEIVRAKRPILSQADVFGWYNQDELVSQIAIYPCEVNVHGTLYQMGGITGVGTYPEYANMGLVRELIQKALESMRENKQYISYLYPYSIPFYRHKGWEIISDQMTFILKDSQLPKTVPVKGHVERLEIDDEDVYRVYDQFARNNHGAMIRDRLAWEEYWRWENEEDRFAAVYYNADEEPTGLCFYWISDEVFNIKEMIFVNQDARKGIWNFIAAHFSMIESVSGKNYSGEPIAFYLEDSDIVETIQPYYMARIVDVEGFLRDYPFADICEPFHFVVEDHAAPWNNRVFGIDWDEEENILISNETVGPEIRLDIGALTTLLMGYKSVSYLSRLGRIVGSQRALRNLKRIVVSDRVYFSDYF